MGDIEDEVEIPSEDRSHKDDTLVEYLSEVVRIADDLHAGELPLHVSVCSAQDLHPGTVRTKSDRTAELAMVFSTASLSPSNTMGSDPMNGLSPDDILSGPTFTRVILSGPAGCGKTHFVHQLASCAVRKCWAHLTAPEGSDEVSQAMPSVPFIVSILDMARKNVTTVSAYIDALYGADSPRALLLQQLHEFGALMLLFDGYDICDTTNSGVGMRAEINETLRTEMARVAVRIVITSRPRRFPLSLFGTFVHLRVLPLSRVLQHTWLSVLTRDLNIPSTSGIHLALKHPACVEMCSTPLALHFMIRICKDSKDSSGATRAAWQQQLLQLFLHNYDFTKHVTTTPAIPLLNYIIERKDAPSFDHLHQLDRERIADLNVLITEEAGGFLMGLALDLYRRNSVYFTDDDVKSLITSDQTGKYGRSWLLLAQSALFVNEEPQYRFISHTLQQYLTARAIIPFIQGELANHTGFTALIRQPTHYFEVLMGARLHAFWNQEVTALICAMMPDSMFSIFADYLLLSDDIIGTHSSMLLALLKERTPSLAQSLRVRISELRRGSALVPILSHPCQELRLSTLRECQGIGLRPSELQLLIDGLLGIYCSPGMFILQRLAALDSIVMLGFVNPAVLVAILERARDPHESERLRSASIDAVKALGKQSEGAAMELVHLLHDGNSKVRERAREALKEDAYQTSLFTRRENIHCAGALVTVGCKDPRASAVLVAKLNSPGSDMRERLHAARVLRDIATLDGKTLQGLCDSVSASTPLGVLRAVTATLRSLLAKRAEYKRENCKAKFSEDQNAKLQEALHAITDPIARCHLLYVLAVAGNTIPLLSSYLSLLDDAFPLVRWAAADALRIADVTNESVEAGLRMLSSSFDNSNSGVVSHIGDAAANVAIARALGSLLKEERIRECKDRIEIALMTGLRPGSGVSEDVEGVDPVDSAPIENACVASMAVLEQFNFGGIHIVQCLFETLLSENEKIRVAAVALIGKFCEPGTSDMIATELINHLSDESAEVRCEIAKQLGNIAAHFPASSSHAADGIIALLANNDESVRLAAVNAVNLANIDKEGVVAYLLGRIEIGADILRTAALWVIGALGTSSPRTIAILESRLADPSLRVRLQAARTLVQLGRGGHAVAAVLIEGLRHEVGAVKAASITTLQTLGVLDGRLIQDFVAAVYDQEKLVSQAALSALEHLHPQSEADVKLLVDLLLVERCAAFVFKPLYTYIRAKHALCPFWSISPTIRQLLKAGVERRTIGALECALLCRDLKLLGAIPLAEIPSNAD